MATIIFSLLLLIVWLIVIYIGKQVKFSTRWILYCLNALMMTCNMLFVNSSINFFEFLVDAIISFSCVFIVFILIRNKFLFKCFDMLLFGGLFIPLFLKHLFKLDFFSHDCFISIFQTNIEEAVNYALGGINNWYIILFIILFILVVYFDRQSTVLSAKKSLTIIFLFSITVCLSYNFSSSLYFIGKYRKEYNRKTKYLQRNRHVDYSDFRMRKPDSLTCIVAIGESLCRDYMSSYGYATKTTKYLDSLLRDSTIIKIDNAYSSDIVTVTCVPRILSSENQFMDNMDYLLPDLLKAKGFKIFWLSNQYNGGFQDSPVSVLADSAHVKRFRGDGKYDHELLPYFQKAIMDEAPLKLIVLHFMGSHFPASSYYPQTEAYLRKVDYDDEIIYHYENSVIYNDDVMNSIFQLVASNKNTMLFYTSDHGEKPGVARLPQSFDYQMCRIPSIIYFSKDLRKKQEYKIINNNKEKYWSNDLMFNLICGSLNISNDKILPSKWNLSSEDYNLDKNNFKVSPNLFKVSEDSYN